MKKFVCPVCGYVHEAAEMPADFKCPLCKVPGSKFTQNSRSVPLSASFVTFQTSALRSTRSGR